MHSSQMWLLQGINQFNKVCDICLSYTGFTIDYILKLKEWIKSFIPAALFLVPLPWFPPDLIQPLSNPSHVWGLGVPLQIMFAIYICISLWCQCHSIESFSSQDTSPLPVNQSHISLWHYHLAQRRDPIGTIHMAQASPWMRNYKVRVNLGPFNIFN